MLRDGILVKKFRSHRRATVAQTAKKNKTVRLLEILLLVILKHVEKFLESSLEFRLVTGWTWIQASFRSEKTFPFYFIQVKYKEVKARNSQLLKMLQQGESELNIVNHMQLLFIYSLFPYEDLMCDWCLP